VRADLNYTVKALGGAHFKAQSAGGGGGGSGKGALKTMVVSWNGTFGFKIVPVAKSQVHIHQGSSFMTFINTS
jgi:hypothetical protein